MTPTSQPLPLKPLHPRPPPAEFSAEDGDLLFRAVLERLRHNAQGLPDSATRSRDAVLECVQALEQLHATLGPGSSSDGRTERELRAALAATRVELTGTRAGERRARHQAEHDGLTQLPNGGSFRARLDHALGPGARHTPRLAVLYLDLDGFKPINDLHGHAAGDETLRIVAERLSRSVRAEDMVCRIGGDEFACLLADPMGHQQLSELAAKLYAVVSAPLKVDGIELSVRPSIGIAVCTSDGDTSAALIKRADTAMYHAKRRQMGYAFFDGGSDG